MENINDTLIKLAKNHKYSLEADLKLGENFLINKEEKVQAAIKERDELLAYNEKRRIEIYELSEFLKANGVTE